MSLRLIYGKAGSGKSHYCIDAIKNKVKSGKKEKLILIVPEQLSFQSEKNIIREVGASGLGLVDVLSFKRLAYTVFKECGGITRKHMDSCGKSMLLYKVLDEIKDDLTVFTTAAKQRGFVDTLADMISEFKRYNVTPEVLNEVKLSVGENSLLYNKITDLSKIYEGFERTLHKDYIDSDDDLTISNKKMDDCSMFDGAHIWIDEFSGFIPQQYNLIEKLLKKAKSVNITINMGYEDGEKYRESDVFAPIIGTENKLMRIAQENGIAIEKPISLNHNKKSRFKDSKELQYLEENYFAYPFEQYKEKVKDIEIFKAVNAYSEIEDTACEILKLVRDKGARFTEIAVVSRDLDKYESVVKSIFEEYKIPYFMDKNKEITNNPIIVLILSALEVYNRSWSYEAVFRYLKSGLLNVDQNGVDILENYVLMSGIKGKGKWNDDEIWYKRIIDVYDLKEKYESVYRVINRIDKEEKIDLSFSNEKLIAFIEEGQCDLHYEVNDLMLNEEDENILSDLQRSDVGDEQFTLDKINNLFNNIKKLNLVRKSLVEGLTPFHDSIKGRKKCREICEELYKFLYNIKVPDIIEDLIEKFKEEGNQEFANEYSQIWNTIMDILDQFVEVMGEEKLTVEEFYKILSTGISQHKMGFIPPSIDQLMVSSVERLKSHETKYLFIIGVNDGVFPSGSYEEGILTDLDRESLKSNGVELAKDTKSKAFDEQYLIYTTLTVPSSYVRISYPIADFEGKTMRPSIIISRLKALFPNVSKKSNIVEVNDHEKIVSPIPTFNNMIMELREGAARDSINDMWKETYSWYSSKEEWSLKLDNILKAFSYINTVNKLDEEKVNGLYSNNNYLSVSRVERYVECPFGYFVRYGLKAKERKQFNLTPPDLGTFMHSVIDKFSKEVLAENLKWAEIDDDWCREKIDEKLNECMHESTGKIFTSSPKYKYMGSRIKRVLSRTIWVIIEHMRRGGFEPIGYEFEFGGKEYPPIEITLESGEKIKLIGKIDRVDKLVMDDGEYFRIIDYKSGNKDFKLYEVYNGLQMQLLTYLDSILTLEDIKKKDHVFPAGVLYFKIDDPMIKSNARLSEEELEKAILKELKMKGLILHDSEIILNMDNKMEGTSLIIPAGLKKDGDIRKGSNVATIEQFEQLREHVRKKLMSSCEEMLNGNIEIKPYKNKDRTPCTYCDYSHICAFDPLLKENNYNIIKELKDNVVWEKLSEEFDDEDEKEEEKRGEKDGE